MQKDPSNTPLEGWVEGQRKHQVKSTCIGDAGVGLCHSQGYLVVPPGPEKDSKGWNQASMDKISSKRNCCIIEYIIVPIIWVQNCAPDLLEAIKQNRCYKGFK